MSLSVYHPPPMPASETPREWDSNRRSSKAQPLYLRLYWQSHLTDLVRLLGYGGSAHLENRAEFHELVEKHGEDKMRAAVEEITVLDETACPPVTKLTAQARKLAVQLLGPTPEQWDAYYRHPNGEPHAIHAQKMAELAAMKGQVAKAPKEKRRRQKPGTDRAVPEQSPGASTIVQQYRDAKERHPGMLLLFRNVAK